MNCVLTEARLVTMQPGAQGYQVTEPQTLVIEQGRIQYIGQHIDHPSDA
ncbi:imidazolonepropionase, partial [Vibrio paracholerae]